MGSSGTLSPASLPAAPIEIHEELWNAKEDIDFVIAWAVTNAAWLATLAGLALASLKWPWIHADALLVLYAGGIIFSGSSVYVIYVAAKSRAVLKEWDEALLPFLYAVKFEMLPVEGTDRELDIWHRYESLWRKLSDAEPKTRFQRLWRSAAREFRTEVKGKKGSHSFNVYARVEHSFSLFVRRFNGPSQVEKADLEVLKADVEDVLKKEYSESFVVGAFSQIGFSKDAIDYAKSEASLVNKEVAFDLVKESPTGYQVLSVDVE